MNTTELQSQIDELRQEITRVNNWSEGIMLLLLQVLPLLLKEHPHVYDQVLASLASSEQDYQKALQGLPTDESLELLEPRKMAYQILQLLRSPSKSQSPLF